MVVAVRPNVLPVHIGPLFPAVTALLLKEFTVILTVLLVTVQLGLVFVATLLNQVVIVSAPGA